MEMTALETQVLNTIAMAPKANREIVAIVAPGGNPNYLEDARPVDRALQKLRKAGLIKPVGGKWHLAEQVPCAHCKGTGKEPAAR